MLFIKEDKKVVRVKLRKPPPSLEVNPCLSVMCLEGYPLECRQKFYCICFMNVWDVLWFCAVGWFILMENWGLILK